MAKSEDTAPLKARSSPHQASSPEGPRLAGKSLGAQGQRYLCKGSTQKHRPREPGRSSPREGKSDREGPPSRREARRGGAVPRRGHDRRARVAVEDRGQGHRRYSRTHARPPRGGGGTREGAGGPRSLRQSARGAQTLAATYLSPATGATR